MKDKIPRGVTTIAKRPQKLFRGKLAEVYDGIGLYCVVAVSDGSTSGVYRARVGAGDFAGGRVFPVGTDVITFVHDGKLEVLTLGNLPGCKCLEDFNQEYTSGWGAGGWDLVWDFYGEGSVGLQRQSAFYTQDGKGIIELLDDTSPNDRYIAVRAAFEYPITLLSKVTVVTPNDEPFGWLTLRMYFTQSTAILTSGICQQYVQIASGNADDKIDLDPGVTTWDAAWTQVDYKIAPDVLIGFTGKPFYWKVYADGRMIMHKVWFVGDEEPEEYQSWEIRGETPLMPGPYYIGIYAVYANGAGDLSAWRLEFDSICSIDEAAPTVGPMIPLYAALWNSSSDAKGAWSPSHTGFYNNECCLTELFDHLLTLPSGGSDSLGQSSGVQFLLPEAVRISKVRCYMRHEYGANYTWKVRGSDDEFTTYEECYTSTSPFVSSSYAWRTLNFGFASQPHRYWRVGWDQGNFTNWREIELYDENGHLILSKAYA